MFSPFHEGNLLNIPSREKLLQTISSAICFWARDTEMMRNYLISTQDSLAHPISISFRKKQWRSKIRRVLDSKVYGYLTQVVQYD